MILVNGKKVEIEYFPNRESKVKEFEAMTKNNVVELFYEDDRDLIHLWFVKLEINNIQKHILTSEIFNRLIIWYMPYSRMDRKIKGDLYTLSYTCAFINALFFNRVFVIDPHSGKNYLGEATIDRAKAIYPIPSWLPQIINETGFDKNKDCLVFPDKGALLRYHDYFKHGLLNTCYFVKERNETTGKIEKMELAEPLPEYAKKAIIIDDICSYGGTFIKAGDLLKEKGIKDITLVVTHLENSVFSGNLLLNSSPIDRIYTSNSMIRAEVPTSKIKVLPVNLDDYLK